MDVNTVIARSPQGDVAIQETAGRPYAPLDRHASLAMTECNLSTPCPGLGGNQRLWRAIMDENDPCGIIFIAVTSQCDCQGG